jgi:hypothetical protein
MEENKNDDKHKYEKYKFMKLDTIVEVPVAISFINQMYGLINYLVEQYGRDKFLQYAKRHIDDKEPPKNELEMYISSLSLLVATFESIADQKGLVKEVAASELEQLTEEQKRELLNGN